MSGRSLQRVRLRANDRVEASTALAVTCGLCGASTHVVPPVWTADIDARVVADLRALGWSIGEGPGDDRCPRCRRARDDKGTAGMPEGPAPAPVPAGRCVDEGLVAGLAADLEALHRAGARIDAAIRALVVAEAEFVQARKRVRDRFAALRAQLTGTGASS